MRMTSAIETARVSGGIQAGPNSRTNHVAYNQCTFDAFSSTVISAGVAGFVGGAIFGPGAVIGGVAGIMGGYAGQSAACLLDMATGPDSSDEYSTPSPAR